MCLIFLLTYYFSIVVCVCVCLAAAWQEVEQRLEGGASGDSLSQGPIQYTEKTPSTTMKSKWPGFTPSASQGPLNLSQHHWLTYHQLKAASTRWLDLLSETRF